MSLKLLLFVRGSKNPEWHKFRVSAGWTLGTYNARLRLVEIYLFNFDFMSTPLIPHVLGHEYLHHAISKAGWTRLSSFGEETTIDKMLKWAYGEPTVKERVLAWLEGVV
jgi:hypothetical protein